ncbi:MAG: CRTAC1 family protein [Rhodothermales bacterium]
MRCRIYHILVGAALALAGCGGSEPEPEMTAKAPYVDVTEAAGLSAFRHETGGYGQSLMPEIVGGGGGFIDYDGDGWPDVLLVQGGIWPHHETRVVQAVRLYRNLRDGRFAEVTDEAGLAGVTAYAFGVAVADTDNDGDEDFLVTTLHRNLFFRNEGGRFVEASKDAGLADGSVWSTSAAFLDADRDGWADLYVGNYVDWTPETDLRCMHKGKKVFCTPQEYTGRASQYYHNNGDGTFTNRTREAGFLAGVDTTLDKTLGVAVLDFNEDGWPDITTGNDTENDFLYVNQGDGTFRESGLQSGVAVSQHGTPRAGMGVDAGVVDSSGNVTIFVGNFSEESVSVFRYQGNEQFEDRSAISRLAYPSNLNVTFGLALLDVDLDTDLDLLTANGHVLTHINEVSQAIQFRQPAQLFLNRGNGTFDEYRAAEGPLTARMVARGLAYADYDRDGDVDVLLVENGGPAHLWRNETDAGRYLRVRLIGQRSTRDGLDAQVTAYVPGLAMGRWVRSGGSFLSSSEKWVTFGLGAHDRVDSLRVVWPSGVVDRFMNVAAGQELVIREGNPTFESSAR